MDIVAAIKSVCDAISQAFGFFGKRQELKNAAPVVQAKVAAQEQAQQDKTNEAIQEKDTNEIREELAE